MVLFNGGGRRVDQIPPILLRQCVERDFIEISSGEDVFSRAFYSFHPFSRGDVRLKMITIYFILFSGWKRKFNVEYLISVHGMFNLGVI